jgi:hypothetical protein
VHIGTELLSSHDPPQRARVRPNLYFYFSVDKMTCESDPTGGQYVESWRTIENTQSILQPLTFDGMGLLLTGILISLFSILRTLKLQAINMQVMMKSR